MEPSSQWYNSVPVLSGAPGKPPSSDKVTSLYDRAASLHSDAVTSYQSKSSSTVTSSSSEYSFLQKILQSGTLSDRLSALTLLVQSSPLHNTRALETLKGMAERGKGKGGREESLKALRCIVDWWVGGGAPNRKLKYFRDHPLSHSGVTDQHLLVWYFEDWLKKYFFSVLKILENLSLDSLTYVRTQALSLISTLLREKPEQEHNLLRLLVNKLGDSEKSICSRVSYHLLQVLQSHPSMKIIVVREMTSLILRPVGSTATGMPPPVNTLIKFDDDGSAPKPKGDKKDATPKAAYNDHARYYAAITFNQIVFGPEDRDVAIQVIDVYFQMFKDLLGEGKSDDDTPEEVVEPEEDPVKQKRKDAGKIQPPKKKREKTVVGEGGFTEVEDSQSKLISAILTGVNRALPYAKLTASDAGLNKHIDTLFLITHTSTFNISLQALVLIQQISSSLSSDVSGASSSAGSSLSKSITDRYFRTLYSSLHDDRLTSSSKQTMYLNLLFKSIKADDNHDRAKSFVRRFIQVLASGGGGSIEFIVGGLYLLGELFSTVPGLREMTKTSASMQEDESESQYDPRKRDPQYAHPSSTPLFELLPLLRHYHPTVSLHAQQLLNAQPITSSADLSLNTLSHFLDRFVYKNPKKVKPKGASFMQPAASANDKISVKLVKGEVDSGPMVNDDKFWRRKIENVPVDEVFFHQYFSRKNQKSTRRTDTGKDGGGETGDEDEEEDDESGDDDAASSSADEDEETKADGGEEDDDEDEEGSDLGEDEIWKAMLATMPHEDGDEDLMEDDSDDLPSDLDDFDDSDGDAPSVDVEDEVEEEDEDDASAQDEDGAAGSEDGLSMAEASDDEDLLAVDDMPDGLIEYDGSDAGEQEGEGEEWGGFGGASSKRKRGGEDKSGKRKKRQKLPTFASYEDYAKMIEDGPEDFI
ncbi:CBF-domain-containing protein [Coniophora puteana RWD-64-598 SS2]|uniref:CBF-domain-containing protein n=1 Tax=Coniophora puteana (strain RWD-64-598) TaxID=741705 RepID=A0A5M3MES9_CONPW|nr:CBF-domain-containing protein [Coniophora puteana RWD-64-598 SS2]EIW77769.1 CBF-domain-containing protein [Coniophora puteana RWD-64-598 SS2]